MNNNPRFVYEFETSYVEMSYSQFFEGYCILFSKVPYESLTLMPIDIREKYLMEMSILGDAMMEVLGALRINYNILGNSHPVVHAHLFPRYEWEEEERRKTVVHRYEDYVFEAPEYQFDEKKHGKICEALSKSVEEHYNKYLKNRELTR